MPFVISLLLAAFISGCVGLVVAVPASRMTGLYLAIASLAFAIIIEDMTIHWESVTGGNRGMPVPPPSLFGYEIYSAVEFYYIVLASVFLSTILVLNLLRAPFGRAMLAIRDRKFRLQALAYRLRVLKLRLSL